MAKYVKLGEAANSFADPFTGFKIHGKQVVEETPEMLAGTKYKNAKKKGHIVGSDKDEFEAYQASLKNSTKAKINKVEEPEEEEEEDDLQTQKTLDKLTKDEIKDLIEENFNHDKTEDEIEGMKKAELIEFYLELQNQ